MTQREVFEMPLGKLLQLVHCSLIANGANTTHRYPFESDATVQAIKRLREQRRELKGVTGKCSE